MQISQKFHAPLRCFIALAIGLIAYLTIQAQYSYWILLSVIVLLPSTTGATIQKAIGRVIGTLIGVLVGLLLIVALPKSIIVYAIIILTSLFLTIYLSRSYYTIAMFFAAILVVAALTYFIAHGNVEQAWGFVLARFFDTLLGAAIVIVTAYVFWPDRTSTKIQQSIVSLETQFHSILQQMLTESGYSLDNSISVFNEDFVKLKELYAQLKHEPNNDFHKFYTLASIIENFYLLKNNLLALYISLPEAKTLLIEHPEVTALLNSFVLSLEKLKIQQKNNQLSNDYFYDLANKITTFQSEGSSIFVQQKYCSLAVLIIALRDIVINMQFIAIATMRMEK